MSTCTLTVPCLWTKPLSCRYSQLSLKYCKVAVFLFLWSLLPCHKMQTKKFPSILYGLYYNLQCLYSTMSSCTFFGLAGNAKKMYYIKDYLSPRHVKEKSLCEILGAMEVADSTKPECRKPLLEHLWPDTTKCFSSHFSPLPRASRTENCRDPNKGACVRNSFSYAQPYTSIYTLNHCSRLTNKQSDYLASPLLDISVKRLNFTSVVVEIVHVVLVWGIMWSAGWTALSVCWLTWNSSDEHFKQSHWSECCCHIHLHLILK